MPWLPGNPTGDATGDSTPDTTGNTTGNTARDGVALIFSFTTGPSGLRGTVAPQTTPGGANTPDNEWIDGSTDGDSWAYGFVNPRCYKDWPVRDSYVEIRFQKGGRGVRLVGTQAIDARKDIGGTWSDDLPVKVTFVSASNTVKKVERWEDYKPEED